MRKLDKQRIRAELIERAMDMMHQSDKHTFSLRQLAKEYGMTPSNMYHYFKNKQELLNEIFPYLYQRIMEEFFIRLDREQLKGLPAKDILVKISMVHIKLMKDHPAYEYLILVYQQKAKEEVRPEEHYELDWFYEAIHNAVIECRIPRTSVEEVYIIQEWISMVNGIIYTWCGKLIDYTEKPEAFIEHYLSSVIYPMLLESN